jgi:hypothetical protein
MFRGLGMKSLDIVLVMIVGLAVFGPTLFPEPDNAGWNLNRIKNVKPAAGE